MNQILNIKKLKRLSGFTVVELLVAMSLFSIVISIVSGVFIRSMRTQRTITAFIAANSNASLAIEQIAREIRTGTDFCIGENIPCGSSELKFTNANGEAVRYSLTGQAIAKKVGDGSDIPITANNVAVKNLSFNLKGEQLGDKNTPRITLSLGVGATGVSFNDALLNLETTISSRVLKD